MPVFKIHHITKYEYDRPVKESVNEIKVFPFVCSEQETLMQDFFITGNPEMQTFTDYWGNKIGLFNILPSHKELVIENKLLIRTTSPSQLHVNFHTGFDELSEEVTGQIQLIELSTTETIKKQSSIEQIIEKIFPKNKSVAEAVEHCGEYIFKNFKYIKGITDIETTVDDILEYRSGVCQDFAHVMLYILRTMKIPSRYVSGYICPNKSGMRGEGATHAWVEAFIPRYGWAGIDPTNNIWVTNTHVKLAVGRHFNDCTPVKGTFKGPARQKLSVYVSVSYEDGHVFEEMNNVKMNAQPSDPKEEEYIDESFAGQQQQ